jgi:cyclopropane fatty-acyl-phospholipid synthase-like methyltransferase
MPTPPSSSLDYWRRCYYENGPDVMMTDAQDVNNYSTRKLWHIATKGYLNRRINYTYESEGNFYRELEQLPLDTMDVLEFGCGPGIEALHMAQSGASVTACDIIPSNITLVDRMLEPLGGRAVLLNSYEGLSGLGQFDLVFSHGVLHHVQPEVLPRILELLVDRVKPGGQALIMVYTLRFFPTEDFTREGPYTRGYSEDQFRLLFGPKLQCTHVRKCLDNHYMWGLFNKVG